MKLKFLIPCCLLLVNCKKENDAKKMVHNGQIVSVANRIGPMIQGPYRIDSLSDLSYKNYDMNFYWVTSNNRVALEMPGDDMVDCNTCTYSWMGPSAFIPDGNSIAPKPNKDH